MRLVISRVHARGRRARPRAADRRALPQGGDARREGNGEESRSTRSASASGSARAGSRPRRASGRPTPASRPGSPYTAVGGDVLFIEATAYPGTGKLKVTGQLGEVMQESAQTALSWVRSHARRARARRRSGSPRTTSTSTCPRARCRRTARRRASRWRPRSSRSSAASPSPTTSAMTGEITLTGQVLPIGGVREKVLAAERAGLKRVILPRENEHRSRRPPGRDPHGARVRARRPRRGGLRGRLPTAPPASGARSMRRCTGRRRPRAGSSRLQDRSTATLVRRPRDGKDGPDGQDQREALRHGRHDEALRRRALCTTTSCTTT